MENRTNNSEVNQQNPAEAKGLGGVIVLILLVAVIVYIFKGFVFTDSDKAVEVVSKEVSVSCLDVPPSVIERISGGLNINGGGSLQNVKAVKSNDFESAYFISGDLQGAGLEGNTDIATFATNRLDATGSTFSVDAVAKEFSDWPLGSGTSFNISMSNHGAQESRDCLGS